jgi:hypothetical protein
VKVNASIYNTGFSHYTHDEFGITPNHLFRPRLSNLGMEDREDIRTATTTNVALSVLLLKDV